MATPSEMTRKPPALMESVLELCATVPPPVAFSVTLPVVTTLFVPTKGFPKPMPVPFKLLSKMSPDMVALPMVLVSCCTSMPRAPPLPVPVTNRLPLPEAPRLEPRTTCTPALKPVPPAPAVPVTVKSPLTVLTAAPESIRTPI